MLAALHLVPISDPILNQEVKEVPVELISSWEVQDLIDRMIVFAKGNQKDLKRPVMCGLAAPQLGIDKRIILIDIHAAGKGETGNLQPFINPEILHYSQEKDEWYEGCYSTGEVKGIVERSKEIVVSFYDRQGKRRQEAFSGFVARIMQHEVDHLNGIRFPIYISDPDKLHWVEDDQMYLYRNQQAWRTWQHKCSREDWESLLKD